VRGIEGEQWWMIHGQASEEGGELNANHGLVIRISHNIRSLDGNFEKTAISRTEQEVRGAGAAGRT